MALSNRDLAELMVRAAEEEEAGSNRRKALQRAAGHPVRVLSTEEEGRLAYDGAIATADVDLPEKIAVCDVGGASTEIAVGSPGVPPKWVTSIDLGSVRLTARSTDVYHARSEAAEAFAEVTAPSVELALAVGGSARATTRSKTGLGPLAHRRLIGCARAPTARAARVLQPRDPAPSA